METSGERIANAVLAFHRALCLENLDDEILIGLSERQYLCLLEHAHTRATVTMIPNSEAPHNMVLRIGRAAIGICSDVPQPYEASAGIADAAKGGGG